MWVPVQAGVSALALDAAHDIRAVCVCAGSFPTLSPPKILASHFDCVPRALHRPLLVQR